MTADMLLLEAACMQLQHDGWQVKAVLPNRNPGRPVHSMQLRKDQLARAPEPPRKQSKGKLIAIMAWPHENTQLALRLGLGRVEMLRRVASKLASMLTTCVFDSSHVGFQISTMVDQNHENQNLGQASKHR